VVAREAKALRSRAVAAHCPRDPRTTGVREASCPARPSGASVNAPDLAQQPVLADHEREGLSAVYAATVVDVSIDQALAGWSACGVGERERCLAVACAWS
jgi:hypothetical protein